MELNTETSFDTLNDIVFETLELKGINPINSFILRNLGAWYYKFTFSHTDRICLIVPFYQKAINKPLSEYLFYLDLLLKLINCKNDKELDDYTLFDIMSYRLADKYNRRNKEFNLRFLNSNKKTLFFEQNVNVASDRFLPMFPIDQIDSYKDEIFDAFFLFGIIAKRDLMPHAVPIDLSKNLTLLITESTDFDASKLLFKHLKTSEFRNDDNKRDEILDYFESLDIKNNINYKYPYHVNIGSTIIKEFTDRSKQFNIELQQRFCYSEITENELVLTPDEINLEPKVALFDLITQFLTIETAVTNDFDLLFKQFKVNWKQEQTNNFSSPFPVKWFMLIHSGKPLSFWNALFIKDYPNTTGVLLREALVLIEIIYEINWVDKGLPFDDSVYLLIPKFNKFTEITSSFKEYVAGKYKNIWYVDEDLSGIPVQSNVWILDPFNILFFSNSVSQLSKFNIKVILPDFINFGYNPYIRYHIAKYQYTALITGARKWADPDYSKNLEDWKGIQSILLNEIRKDVNEYYEKFNSANEKIELQITNEETGLDDLELSESEVIQFASKKEERLTMRVVVKNLLITVSDGSKIVLKQNEPVLLDQNGFIIKTVASLLDINSRFIPVNEIVKTLDVSLFADRMTAVSQKARSWRYEMFLLEEKESNLFSILSKQGLSVSVGTFNKDYVSQRVENDDFQLPRSKTDWKLVCEKIGVTDMLATWMAHKFRSDINALKRAYCEIINFLILKDSFGINVTDSILKHVSNILSTLPDMELDDQEMETNTRLVIAEINRRIKLSQVKHIKEQEI